VPLPVLLSLSTADTSEIRSIDTVFGSMDRALAKPVRIDSVCSTVMESAVRPKIDSFCFIMYVVVLRTTVLGAAEDVLLVLNEADGTKLLLTFKSPFP